MLTMAGLICDVESCSSELVVTGNLNEILNAARAGGWHLFDGTTIGGKDLIAHICPGCMGVNVQPSTIRRLEGEQLLW